MREECETAEGKEGRKGKKGESVDGREEASEEGSEGREEGRKAREERGRAVTWVGGWRQGNMVQNGLLSQPLIIHIPTSFRVSE